MFTNGEILRDIRNAPSGKHIIVNTSGGTVTTHQQHVLPGFGMVWHHQEGTAKVLSLSLISKHMCTTMDGNS